MGPEICQLIDSSFCKNSTYHNPNNYYDYEEAENMQENSDAFQERKSANEYRVEKYGKTSKCNGQQRTMPAVIDIVAFAH